MGVPGEGTIFGLTTEQQLYKEAAASLVEKVATGSSDHTFALAYSWEGKKDNIWGFCLKERVMSTFS